MSELPSKLPARRAGSIVDLVFAGEPGSGTRRRVLAGVLVLSLYASAFTLVRGLGRSAGPWSAEMAARIHDAISMERAVALPPPPPPPAAPVKEPAPTAAAPARVARAVRVHAAPAAPAQAAQLAAASPAPADFTGIAFVVGSGTTYAGGTTTSTGTSRTPVSGVVAPGGTGNGAPRAPSRARAVALDQSGWNCPWPAEADAQQVNEQTVVLRATVRPDGRAERVDVLSDPGFGFGNAARECALATQFEPAHNPAGQPIAALSPPIRVHFFR